MSAHSCTMVNLSSLQVHQCILTYIEYNMIIQYMYHTNIVFYSPNHYLTGNLLCSVVDVFVSFEIMYLENATIHMNQ
jgi:hypothetical protein